jgi:hypothetical protein
VSLRPQRLCLESFPKLGNETLFILALVEMVMLMGLDPIPTPELLRYLRAMGHGDETVVVDGSFFTAPVAKRLDGERAKAGEARRDSHSCFLRGIRFVWSTLIDIVTVGESHTVDHRSKVGRWRKRHDQ